MRTGSAIKVFMVTANVSFVLHINTFSPSASTSPNNTGVIAASVVVAILLMVILAVLLFLYLRMRECAKSQTQDSSGNVADPGFANDLYELVSTYSLTGLRSPSATFETENII